MQKHENTSSRHHDCYTSTQFLLMLHVYEPHLSSIAKREYRHHSRCALQNKEIGHWCNGFLFLLCKRLPNPLLLSCRAWLPLPAACGDQIHCNAEPDKNDSAQSQARSEWAEKEYHNERA